jgi:RHS repeat-associated protein
LFVYLSNETKYEPVFFDNLVVQHYTGPLVEETQYYPFGLVQQGISSRAFGRLQNKEKTFQGQRFDPELSLNWVQFKWRNHDPQLGRFWQVDPLAEKYTHNSTYAFSENKVTGHVELEGLEAMDIRDMIENDKVINGEMTLDQRMTSIRNRSTVGMIGVGIMLSLLIPGPDEILLASLIKNGLTLLRGIKSVEQAKKVVDEVRLIERALDNAADLKKAEAGLAKVTATAEKTTGVVKRVTKEAVEQVSKSFNKISDNLLKKAGIDAHQLKRDFLGNKAKISQYDLYKDTKTGEILILQKGGKGNPIQTGEFLK